MAVEPVPQLGLTMPNTGRGMEEILNLVCESAAHYTGGKSDWQRLRARFAGLYQEAQEVGATQGDLAALAEQIAPAGSLWARTQDGPRYQLRRWDHQLGAARPRPFVVLDASGEGQGRRQAHLKVPARELFTGRWWRVT